MATSGSFNTSAYTGSQNSPRYYTFSWSLTNQSIEGNYSDISWSLKGAGGNSDSYWVYVKEKYVTVNGSTQSNSDIQQTYNGTVAFNGTARIYHNTDGTKSFSASAGGAFYYYGSYNSTGSGSWELPQIPRYATSNQSVSSKTETSIKMNWSSDSNIDYLWYSTDWGTTWKAVGSVNAKSGTYTISTQSKDSSSLSANTTYNIITRVRRKDSQLTTNSSKLSVTTYSYPHITKVGTNTIIIGNSQTLTIYNPLSRSITVKMNKDTATGSQLYSGTTSGTSITFTPTANTLYSSIPNSQSGKAVYTVVYGSVHTQSTSGEYYYKIKGTETPTLGTITYADTNSTVTAITGNNQHIVQNQSNLKVTYTSATAKNSASISKHTFVLNGVTKSSTSASGTIDFGKIDSGSNLTLTITATDSRGLTVSTTKTITMFEHKKPTAIVTLERLNNYEDESYLTVDGSVSSVNSKNTMTIKYRYKISGGSYGSFTTISDKTKQTLSLNKNNVYIFNVVITDAFGSTYDKEHPLGKGTFPFFIDTDKNSLGMNALPRAENVFEIGGRIVELEREFSIPTNTGTKTGWYLAMSGSITGYGNRGFMIAIQQTFSGPAGILYINLRCNNETTLIAEYFHWISYTRLSNSDICLKIDGNNFYLYLKTTSNYQQYYIKVLQEKSLNGWNFQQYKIYTPTYTDVETEAPTGTNPTKYIKTLSSKGALGWTNQTDGDAYVVSKSFIAWWNGAYSDTNSNLTYCHQGEIQAKPKTLFENVDGTGSTITLSENINNFNYIEIYARESGNARRIFTKAYKLNGSFYNRVIVLNAFFGDPSSSKAYSRMAELTVTSDTQISFSKQTMVTFGTNSVTVASATNPILVNKIVGYK